VLLKVRTTGNLRNEYVKKTGWTVSTQNLISNRMRSP
jgi:hypothetical protein